MDPSELNIPGLRPPAPPSGDENVRAILRFGLWMVVSAVVIYAVLFGMFQYFDRQAAAADPARNPLLVGEQPPATPAARFPQPRLQSNAAADLVKLQAAEEEKLASFGWVDRNAGIVRMPIEHAMQMVAARGVPVWPAPPPQAAQTSDTKQPCALKLIGTTTPQWPQPDWTGDLTNPVIASEVTETGSVGNATILRSSGSSTMDKAVLEAVRRYRFAPAPGCGNRETKVTVVVNEQAGVNKIPRERR